MLAVLLYLPTVGFDFVYDDVLQITLNPQVNGGSERGFGALFSEPTPPGNLYRPLATASYRITFMLGGGAAWIFHLVNVLLYGACAALVYALYQRYLTTGAAFIAALLFVIHPLHVEVVANSIGRAELLAALGGLGGFLLLTGSGGIRRSALGAALVFGGALAKESTLTAYPLALGLVLLRGRAERRYGYAVTLFLLCGTFALIYVALRARALGGALTLTSDGVAWVENPVFHLEFFERLIPCLKVLGDYVALLLVPVRLSADYSAVVGEFHHEVYSPVGALRIGLFLLYVGLVWHFRRERWGFLGWWFLGAFLLTANLVVPIGTIMGERLAFLPSVGFIGFMVGMAAHFRNRFSPVLVRFSVAGVVLFFSVRTLVRIPVWQTQERLLSQTVLDQPRSPKALYNYGVELFVRQRDLAGAERIFLAVLSLVPDHLLSLQCLADIALQRGDAVNLERWYRRILELRPGEPLIEEQLRKLLEMEAAEASV